MFYLKNQWHQNCLSTFHFQSSFSDSSTHFTNSWNNTHQNGEFFSLQNQSMFSCSTSKWKHLFSLPSINYWTLKHHFVNFNEVYRNSFEAFVSWLDVGGECNWLDFQQQAFTYYAFLICHTISNVGQYDVEKCHETCM